MRQISIVSVIISFLVFTLIFTNCDGTPSSPVPSSSTTTPASTPTSTPTYTPISITWESMNGPSGGRISQFIQNPGGNHELYALSLNGIYKSVDRGESWQQIDGSDDIGASSIAVYQDKLFVSGYNGVYYFNDNDGWVQILSQFSSYLTVSDNKLFMTITIPGIQPVIRYTDLTSDEYEWKEISPPVSALGYLHLPDNPSLWYNVNVRNIVALENRILAGITMEIEGSGAETHGGLMILPRPGSISKKALEY
jgi:hypothetical protein